MKEALLPLDMFFGQIPAKSFKEIERFVSERLGVFRALRSGGKGVRSGGRGELITNDAAQNY